MLLIFQFLSCLGRLVEVLDIESFGGGLGLESFGGGLRIDVMVVMS